MVQISGPNERFLQTPVVIAEILRILEPDLAFIDKIPHVDTGGDTPTYYQKNQAAADPKKQVPRMRTPSSKFPEVEISRITKRTALLNEEGISFRLDKDALRKRSGIDMIQDAFQNVGYWLGEYLNGVIYDTMRAGGTDAGMTPTAVWSDPAATPVEDMRVFKNAMRREGYPYRMTDIFIEQVNFNELEGYLVGHEIPQFREAAMAAGQSRITLPLEGKPEVTGLYSGVTHGDVLGIDRNKPAATFFYNNDPQFSTHRVSYETVVNGAKVTKTVPNIGLNVHKYWEDDTHDTVVQLWFDFTVVVKDAFGIMYDDGL